jgi:hypothetical protein
MFSTIKSLFYGRELEYEALKRRARRNFRTLKQELRVLVFEALERDVQELLREREAQQQGQEVSDA